jgi:hypothetical protein
MPYLPLNSHDIKCYGLRDNDNRIKQLKTTKNDLQCYSCGGKITLFSRFLNYYSKFGLSQLIRFKLHTKKFISKYELNN